MKNIKAIFELLRESIKDFRYKLRWINKKYQIGIYGNFNESNNCLLFCEGLIRGRNEFIKKEKIHSNGFIIETDKTIYKFVVANESARGYRFDEAFISIRVDRKFWDRVDMSVINKHKDIKWKLFNVN